MRGNLWGYARPSNWRGAPTLDEQRAAIARYAADRGWPFDPARRLFIDAASAHLKDFWHRPAGEALYRAAWAGDRLIVASLDRAFRTVRDCSKMLEVWAAIELHVVGLGGPVGRLSGEEMARALAALERAARSERAAVAAAKSRYHRRPVNGVSPYGFQWARRPGSGAWCLAENPEERAIMGRMLAWYEAGWSVDAIRQHLTYTLKVELYRRRGRELHLVKWTNDAVWRRIQAEARLRQQEAGGAVVGVDAGPAWPDTGPRRAR